jgi:hypothetical protein
MEVVHQSSAVDKDNEKYENVSIYRTLFMIGEENNGEGDGWDKFHY